MEGFGEFWGQTDGVGRAVALLMLAMSVSAWVVIFWKTWVLRRAAADLQRGLSAFWAAPDALRARERVEAIDRERVLLPMVDAWLTPELSGTLATQGTPQARLTRRLREALQRALGHLRLGQVLLASIGSTAPFIGLFGTVWGIYHALTELSSSGGMTVDKVSGPVGEALIMTAAGLAVAIPAVLAYNLFGKWIGEAEAALEGLAHDLLDTPPPPP